MTEHARHALESIRLAEARAASLIPGSPAWDRHVKEHGEPQEAPEILANRGLFADSGGAYDN